MIHVNEMNLKQQNGTRWGDFEQWDGFELINSAYKVEQLNDNLFLNILA